MTSGRFTSKITLHSCFPIPKNYLLFFNFLGGGSYRGQTQVAIPASSFIKRRDSSSSLSKHHQDAAMSDSASTIDKEPSDAELVKKNGSSLDASSVNKEDSASSDGGAKESPDSSLHTRVNSAIETMLMNKNGKKVVYISDGPMKGSDAASSAGNDRERETTVSNSNSAAAGMKGNLLHYSEPLLISARYRAEHSLDRTERTGAAPAREERAGTIVVRSREFGRDLSPARDANQMMDYPPHYRLSYHPNLYAKRSLSKASAEAAETERDNQSKSNNEKRPSAIVYSNFPANLIEVPTKQQVYFNSDDPLFETGKPLVDSKHLGKNTKYDDYSGRPLSNGELDRRARLRLLDRDHESRPLISSNYPRNIRYNPSSPNLSSSSSLTNHPPATGALDEFSSREALHVKTAAKSNVISQLIRVQQPSVVKSTSVTYDSV